MKKILLPEENENLKYYKANLHCHSTVSDGAKTPEQLKADYKAHGYSILAITDHEVFIPHNELSDEDFLMLNGYEIEASGTNGKTCHLCFVALSHDNTQEVCFSRPYLWGNAKKKVKKVNINKKESLLFRKYNKRGINKLIETGKKYGFFVTYNHPTWSLESYPQYIRYKNADAMEITNYGCVVCGFDDDNGHAYDDMLRNGEKLFCISTDDNHNLFPDSSPDCDSYGGYIMIASPSLKYEDVTTALKKGMFYSSTGTYKHIGPEFHSITLENNEVHIKTGDVRSIAYIPSSRDCQIKNAEDGGHINEATFKIKKKEKYFRIVITDSFGYKAYSNAYFPNEF
ncbi:MAG: hypothetical protein J1F24_06930 [Oscillospiraceae bacterium]|nr:hypothetical protein [Oscillospiraceae bacterium]